MTRWQNDHDPLCRMQNIDRSDPKYWNACDCILIAKVRADERKRTALANFMERAYADDVLAELRAKVEALAATEVEHLQKSDDDDPIECRGRIYAYEHVLDLIDGE